jgi:hypothetical protein
MPLRSWNDCLKYDPLDESNTNKPFSTHFYFEVFEIFLDKHLAKKYFPLILELNYLL